MSDVSAGVLFLNGIGDHLLALPAIRAFARIFPGRLTVAAHAATADLFFGALPLKRLIEVRAFTVGTGQEPEFDVGPIAEAMGRVDAFVSMCTFLSRSILALGERLSPGRTVGFFDAFDVAVDRPAGVHASEWYFGLVRAMEPTIRFDEFVQPPTLPARARTRAQRLRRRVNAPILLLHNETSAEKMWPGEAFAPFVHQFLRAHRRCHAVMVNDRRRLRPSPPWMDGLREHPRVTTTSWPLADAIALASVADVFCGADSMMLHAADLFGVPSVGLFGPTDPREFGCRIAPCRHLRGRPLIANLSLPRVLAAAHEMWAHPARRARAHAVTTC